MQIDRNREEHLLNSLFLAKFARKKLIYKSSFMSISGVKKDTVNAIANY